MKIFISPAKKINEEKVVFDNYKSTKFHFDKEVKYLVNELKEYNLSDIKNLMGLSDNLSKLNYDRYQKWNLKADSLCPAIFMFQGDVYKGLKANQLNSQELDLCTTKIKNYFWALWNA